MKRFRIMTRMGMLLGVLVFVSAPARADLATEFDGFTMVDEAGISGLKSSYYSDTKADTLLPNYLHELGGSSGAERVSYPHGIGQVPSPGSYDATVARTFDEGALGVKVDGENLVVQVAGGLDPEAGYFYWGWKTWYGQGDVFVTVDDSDAGVRHYALLNRWPRDGNGDPRTLDGGHFDDARDFHTQGGPSGTSLEGHLVGLSENTHVVATGGAGSYNPDYVPPPEGLDYRTFAQGGQDLGDAGLTLSQTTDAGYETNSQTWYVQTWTLPIEWLSSDTVFDIGLHKAASCGNDQIGMSAAVEWSGASETGGEPIPAPSAVVLGIIGLVPAVWLGRRPVKKRPQSTRV